MFSHSDRHKKLRNLRLRAGARISRFLSGLTEQGWQPVDVGFTVRVQECEDFSSGHRRSQQPRADKTLTLLSAHDADLGKSGHVLFKRSLEVIC